MARSGAEAYWSWAEADLEARAAAGERVSALEPAEARAALGRVDEAFAGLERAREDRDPRLMTLRTSPVWDALRADPRFQRLVESLRFDRSSGSPLEPRQPQG